jgi:hypothetical protein
MLNAFQVYDRGTITLPVKDDENRYILPFASLAAADYATSGSLIDPLTASESWLGESGTVLAVVADDEFTTDDALDNVSSYAGCIICIPSPAGSPGQPYLAEVNYDDRSADPIWTIKTNLISGKDHTDLYGGGVPGSYVQAEDVWYLMHKRYWLDLLYDRIDLYKPQLMRKFANTGLSNKTMIIEQEDIVDLGTVIRKAVHELHASISNFSGLQCSVAYRPDYDVGLTVQDIVLKTPRYLITACEYIFSGDGADVNLKLVNFDKDVV